ncbi:MAG TPA: hypothetical protein VFC71_04840 [Candidatus Polarisedimenticolia bacterium]|nr:hypothetical protein [Candidatus Polarisedimenticolia bacterium]
MSESIDAFIHEYTRRYVAHDVDGVVDLCEVPFLAVREGKPIHMADREAVHDHFALVIDAYANAGYSSFAPVEIDTHELGERSAFTTVRWHAFDAEGNVARDSRTTYQLLSTESGWRFLSYTNHF